MKPYAVRRLVFLGIVVMLSSFVVLLASGHLTKAIAQEESEPWITSAEAPPGMPIERFSPPDSQPLADQGPASVNAPDALVSWRVVGAALKPRENDVSYSVNGTGSCSYVTAGDSSTVWNITPDLPQGAVINTLRMYYYDTSASNTSAYFTIYDLYGSIVQEWSVNSSGNSGNSFNDSAAINHTVDYSIYSYLVNWRPNAVGATLQLCGFRVFYEPPPFGLAFLPTILNNP